MCSHVRATDRALKTDRTAFGNALLLGALYYCWKLRRPEFRLVQVDAAVVFFDPSYIVFREL